MIDGGLKALFKAHFPTWHWQAIETGGTGRGIPDLNYCHGGKEGWIECKKTFTFKVGLMAEQVAWVQQRARHGGRVCVAVRRQGLPKPALGLLADSFWLFGPEAVPSLVTHGLLGPAPLLHANGNPAKWPWNEIGLML